MAGFRFFVRYAGMPVLMVAAGWVTFALLSAGVSRAVLLPAMGFAVFVIVWALEWLVPFRPAWTPSDGQRWQDFGHALFGTGLGGTLGNVMTMSVAGLLVGEFADASGRGVWPAQWPVSVQVALVFLVADLGRYIQHRVMHVVPVLWRFHELHHSVNVMNVWKTSRNHFIERLFQQPFLLLPVIVAGASAEVILPFIVVNSYLGVFDHSNVDFRLGVLETVIMGPAAHRLHHSLDPIEGNTNFGTSLVVWDRLFGTYTNPMKRGKRGWHDFHVGIAQDPTPPGFLAQVIEPFRKRKPCDYGVRRNS